MICSHEKQGYNSVMLIGPRYSDLIGYNIETNFERKTFVSVSRRLFVLFGHSEHA